MELGQEALDQLGLELTIDREWVDVGLIPWNLAVRDRMEALATASRRPLILDGLAGAPIPGTADFAEGAFTLRSRRWMENDRYRSYLVDIFENEEPARIQFRPGLTYSPLKSDPSDTALRQAWEELLGNEVGSESGLEQRQLALKLRSRPGFDVLLAPDTLREVSLFDHQLKAVQRVLQEMRGRALLCDEVGLGKTIEAAMILMEYVLRGLVKSALILCPPSLVGQWREEMQRKFNRAFDTHEDEVFRKSPDPFGTCRWLIASIDTLKRSEWAERLQATPYDLIIVDEAHRLKNDKTLAFRLVSGLPKKFILLLTATPVENRLDELFNLITLLAPGHLDTRGGFRKRFIAPKDPLQPKNPDELRRLLRGVMIRNRRSSTGVIVTRRQADSIEVQQTAEEARFYEQVSGFVREQYLAAGAKEAGQPVFNRMTLKTLQKELGSSSAAVRPTLERLAAHPGISTKQVEVLETLIATAKAMTGQQKLRRLIELLQSTRSEKVVIFTGYRQTQAVIMDQLQQAAIDAVEFHGQMSRAAKDQAAIDAVEFHGQMSRAAKDQAVTRFSEDVPVLVSTESGGEGRNLQFCHLMVNYDLPWNPMKIEQRIGRIHRIGQTRDVHVYNLVAANTVEMEVLRLLDAKLNLFQLVVGELDMILGRRSNEGDLEDIIMALMVESRTHEEFRARIDDLGEEYLAAKRDYDRVKATDAALFDGLVDDANQ